MNPFKDWKPADVDNHNRRVLIKTERKVEIVEGPPVAFAPKVKHAGPDVYRFQIYLRAEGLPSPLTEYRFHPVRMWRFDLAWPAHKVALEIEGGIWIGGRHTRGAGYAKDLEKYNTAAALGWRVLRVQPADLLKPTTLQWVRATLAL